MRIDPKQIKEKHKILEASEKKLKGQFFGIDQIIEEVLYNLRPWFILPPIDKTPTIINLWGMTGVGKTSLVRAIAEDINVPLLEVDMGAFKGFERFGEYFHDHFSDYTQKKCIILLDEFQKCRTVSRSGDDLEDSSIRDAWSLLSDGNIQTPEYYNSTESLILDLQRRMENEIRLKTMPPPKSEEERNDMEDSIEAMMDYEYREKIEDLPEDTWFFRYHAGKIDISPRKIKEISFLCSMDQEEVANLFQKDSINACKIIINKLVTKKNQNTMLNFSQSLVFVCGNLDDLYIEAYNTNPDIDADGLNRLSKNITVPDVKDNLLNKFKLEQIARFGNTHLIYPSLSSSDYKNIIRSTIRNLQEKSSEAFGIDMKIDDNIIDLIYREGVYPTQGTRPVFSTIKNLLEANIPKFIYSFVQSGQTSIRKVSASYDKDKESIVWKSSKYSCSTPVITKLENLKKPKRDDFHSVVAVHEAGHAVALVKVMNIYPEKVTVFSPNANTQSYNILHINNHDISSKTKDFLTGQIVMGYSGYTAECAVFGEDYVTQGSKSDLAMAANVATEYIINYGFSEDPYFAAFDENEYPKRTSSQEEAIEKLLKQSYKEAMKISKEHEHIILALADQLLQQESMSAEDVKKVFDKFNFKPTKDSGALKKFEKKLLESSEKYMY